MKVYKIMATTFFFSIASDYNVTSNERHIKIHIQQSTHFDILKGTIHNELIMLIDFMESPTAEFL